MIEAATKVSDDARAEAPAVPWPLIVAMRHRLVHAYFDIDRTVLWNTATKEIPALLTQLRPLSLG